MKQFRSLSSDTLFAGDCVPGEQVVEPSAKPEPQVLVLAYMLKMSLIHNLINSVLVLFYSSY